MAAPDDFGLTPAQTLAHTSEASPARWHRHFWEAWQEAVDAARPRLTEWRAEPDPADTTPTHELESYRHVRLGCRIVEPTSRPISAVLVAAHGYAVSDTLERVAQRWKPVAERGVAVLLVRVRGFPGSQRDTGDLTGKTDPRRAPHGWICVGLDAVNHEPHHALNWVLPQAVADIALACRAARARFGRQLPLYLHGESFSAGLAVIAAARIGRSDPIDRFVLALPTFGDWPWRLRRRYGPPSASGEQIRQFLVHHAAREHEIRQSLLLCDATVHARRVTATTLCKLAERDEVVPAPTASAVANALATDPARLWRFIVPCGHHDAGLADARRHALFARAIEDFFDPTRPPENALAPWLPLLRQGERTPDGEDPIADPSPLVNIPANAGSKAPPTHGAPTDNDETGPPALRTGDPPRPISLFGADPLPTADDRDTALIDAYVRANRTLDDLPYTQEFEQIYEQVGAHDNRTRAEVFHRLHNLRKAGKLPRLGRAATPPVRVNPDDEARLAELVIAEAGALGQRDRLPYTEAFERVAAAFAASVARDMEPHALWRLICKIAK